MSSLADQLNAVKLKKSKEPIKDFSSPKTAGFLKEEDIKEYEKCVLEVNTEHWIDLLKGETFPTVLCPFLLEEAQVFIGIYERLYLNKDHTDICNTDWRDKITDSEKTCLEALTTRLQTSMNTYTKDGFAFVKTSSRSAKDAPLVQNHLKDLYRKELMTYPAEERSENVQIMCLLKAAFIALRVKTADEVVDMFMRSERIYQDLLLAAVNQKDKYHEHFVIRKFFDIDIDMEFRGFVSNYELVALSQYNYAICSERLVKEKEKYGQMVKNYFQNTVQPKLKGSKFPKHSIIDFAICEKGAKLWVIEVNPFLETTDGALFSWNHERDILEGSKGFVFRITEKPRPGAKTILPQSVRGLLEEKENI
ncbi:uncharacterized protein LOC123531612 [Mercenaria mercenaria]|uniref:uncharacterized protein LOC123531612 n=1 Tax=Mercenaria mercenaria TaxID=6596 RepID=UPI00234F3E85|nr:uncharacterized protein LOC123531612 [Mercenaria mercenaria]XP_053374672.1 uncharacterized protein LOC123531612 [Mercenaria mercenaria]